MFPSRTNEHPPFSQFPQYLINTSYFGTTTNNQSLVATPEKTEAPNLLITENMNYYYYDDPLANKCRSVVFPSRIVQPEVGKKDRHCKIVTARGPRDRRMRLSVDIAKKFFGLQDMLGFDKASKTLDWLLTKSKSAIEELAQKKILGVMESGNNGDLLHVEKLAREARRDKARARARERTRKKLAISTTVKVGVEMGRQFCNNDEELSHGGMLLPCSGTGNAWDLSSLVASMSTKKDGQSWEGNSI